jgi:3-hydroxyisobutyrate dehydrogenase-like beta-hydroxyacid dehydrogenase
MGRSKSKNIGLIGLGIIGTRVAATLRKRGYRVFVWNRTPKPEQNFLGSPVEVAEVCDVVQIFVGNDEALLSIARQLSPGLTAQHVVLAHSTVAPETTRAAAEIVQRRGARFLEAPFTGSKVAAENGQLVYYIGGDEAALKQVRPVLEGSSKEIILIGEIGDASIIKVATNIVTAATAQIGAEALALVRKAGLSAELFSRAMKYNASNSATLEMKIPLMSAGDYATHFSVKHMLKDVCIASKLAESYSLKLPVTELSGDILLDEIKRGHGEADYSSVAQVYFPSRAELAVAKPAVTEVPKPVETNQQPAEVRKVVEKAPEPVKPATPQPAKPPTPEPVNPPTPEPVNPATPEPVKPEPFRIESAQPPVPPEPEMKTKEPKPKKEEIPEGVNLSGGFRGWLSRRSARRGAREDAGAG